MVLSTAVRDAGGTPESVEQFLQVLKQTGFQYISFNFPEIQNLLSGDCITDDEIIELLGNSGFKMDLAHGPMDNPIVFPEYNSNIARNITEQRIKRVIKICSQLKIKWLVLHIGTYIDANGQFDLHKSVASNAAYLNDIVATAADQEVGIAIENGTNMLQEVHPQPQELIALCDLFNEKYQREVMGICFDFGHANIGGLDIPQAIKEVGQHLKVTHLHDNDGLYDYHRLPFRGKIDWPKAMRALGEIDFKGELSLEVECDDINAKTGDKDFLCASYSVLQRLAKMIETSSRLEG